MLHRYPSLIAGFTEEDSEHTDTKRLLADAASKHTCASQHLRHGSSPQCSWLVVEGEVAQKTRQTVQGLGVILAIKSAACAVFLFFLFLLSTYLLSGETSRQQQVNNQRASQGKMPCWALVERLKRAIICVGVMVWDHIGATAAAEDEGMLVSRCQQSLQAGGFCTAALR